MDKSVDRIASRTSIRSLRFALTLSEELHFGRAAQRHYIAAQPFGQVIRSLEADIGYPLFERTSRRVSVSAQGLAFLDRARNIVGAFDTLISTSPTSTDREHMTIAVLGFGISSMWGDFEDGLRMVFPTLAMSFKDVTLAEQYDAVRSGQADVGFVQAVDPVDGVDLIPVAAGPRVAVVPRRSDLADAIELSVSDVADSPFLDVEMGSQIQRWAGEAWGCGRRGDRVRYPAAISHAVALTGRIAVHAATASTYYPHPEVAFVPLEGDDCTVAVAVRTSDHRPVIELVRTLALALPAAGTTSDCNFPG